jgi:hypothetical protein
LRSSVLKEYRIPSADPGDYDLITPGLGGADDIRNLWPHSYSSTWNARVKDELEYRLRDLVCSGHLELAEAQREIATNWIVAYKNISYGQTAVCTNRADHGRRGITLKDFAGVQK